MFRSLHRIAVAALCALLPLCNGCKTAAPGKDQPLSDSELRDFFSRAQDPRRFWITVYESKGGPVLSGVNRLHPEHMALREFSSLPGSTAPVIAFDYGRDFENLAIVDTSSKQSWIDYPTAIKAQVVPLGPPAYPRLPAHVADKTPGYASIASKLRFDQLHVETALLFTRATSSSLGPLTRGQTMPTPDVVLGTDFLRAFEFVQFDYKNRRILFSSTLPYKPDPKNVIAEVSAHYVEGALAAKGLIDGQPETFLLDSAGDFGLMMATAPAEPIRQISIGDLVLRNITATATNNLGLAKYPRIGREILSKFTLTLLGRKGEVIIERPGISPHETP